MAHEVLLICGRSLKQGTSANKGKDTDEYREVTGTLELHPEDAAAAGVADGGRAVLASPEGSISVTCRIKKPDELQPGSVFMAYGPLTSLLMGGDTHGTGMPDSKNLLVTLSPVRE